MNKFLYKRYFVLIIFVIFTGTAAYVIKAKFGQKTAIDSSRQTVDETDVIDIGNFDPIKSRETLLNNSKYTITGKIETYDKEDNNYLTGLEVLDNKSTLVVLVLDFSSFPLPNYETEWIDDESFFIIVTAAPPTVGVNIYNIPTKKEWHFDAYGTKALHPTSDGQLIFLAETENSRKIKQPIRWQDGFPVVVVEEVIYKNRELSYTGKFQEKLAQ